MLTLNAVLCKSQATLKRALLHELTGLGYHTRSKTGFLYGAGTVPVLLVAHLDTVHAHPVKTICTSRDGNIIMSPEGIGGDDRAGVYMILQLIRQHKCHVLFCEDEEVGGIGARCFTVNGIRPDVNYIVELDRRGEHDAVFYDCGNPEFTEFVCSHGFVENEGSFSDISIIAPYLGVAAVNISAGYYNEHTRFEHINLAHMHKNIERLSDMIGTATERFQYIEALSLWDTFYEHRLLSPLSSGDYLLGRGGELLEPTEWVWMDRQGGAFEFLDENFAEELRGVRVVNAQGLPARFDESLAVYVTVVPEEYI